MRVKAAFNQRDTSSAVLMTLRDVVCSDRLSPVKVKQGAGV